MTDGKLGRGALSRRSFLGVAGAAPLALAAGIPHVRAAAGIPIALQLYSLRGDCQADFDACLDAVAKMGFTGVEFAGYFGYAGKGAELRKRLDGLGLKAAGTHIRTEQLEGDALKETIDFHQAIGCRFLVVPGSRDFTDPEKSKALADTFNRVAEQLAPLGMACGYHNHTAEFKTDGGKAFWDLFAERTKKEVILQQDCGWTFAAGPRPGGLREEVPGAVAHRALQADRPRGGRGEEADPGARLRAVAPGVRRVPRRTAAPSGSCSNRSCTPTARRRPSA